MRYLSVCSGIEAASVAWHELGWQPVGFAEIEKFPSQVLAHRFPGVKNYGDMTKFKEWDLEPGTIDILVGGTPCQAFSVAGLRKGLADPRGNLALTFVAMVDHLKPEWVVFENVPGVLSSNKGRDFGSFLGALGELGYGWAYRILDAQYFGVAQRRRRVFVIAHSSGDPRRCASVLFEPESLCGNPPPSRETGQETTAGAGTGVAGGREWPARIAPTLNAAFGAKQGLEDQHVFGGAGCFVMSSGQSNAAINQDQAHTLTSLHETQILAHIPEVANAITSSMANSCLGHNKDENVLAIDAYNQSLTGSVSKTVASRDDQDTASLVAVYESHPNDSRVTGPVEQCPTVSARWGTGGNNTPLVTDGSLGFQSKASFCTGIESGISVPITTESKPAVVYPDAVPLAYDDRNQAVSTDTHHTLRGESAVSRTSDAVVQPSEASAFSWQCRGDMRGMVPRPTAQLQRCQIEAVMVPEQEANCVDIAPALTASGRGVERTGESRGQDPVVAVTTPRMAVRRLTPVECERLQGFPDGWTDIRPGGKDTADSPRYKALGNSMAVPVMRWIGMRINNSNASR